jgi:hypothetical protein
MKMKAMIIVCATALAVGVLFCVTFYSRNWADDVINVTGMGRQDFTSDLISWKARFTASDPSLTAAYGKLSEARKRIVAYLDLAKVSANEVVFEPVGITKNYTRIFDRDGNYVDQRLAGYLLTQGVRVDSREVDKVEAVSRSITELIKEGLEIFSEPPAFFYSGIADLKLQLIAMATKDARLRAERIAENSGGRIGKLRYVNLGVFQIIGLNESPEASWEGEFDTGSKNKTATITVKIQYGVR